MADEKGELIEKSLPKEEKGKDVPSDWATDLEVTLEDLDKPFPLHPF